MPAVKACSEMDGRVVCVHDPFSGRRYEQFKNAAEFHKFDADCKAGVRRAEPILRKYKMPLAIENHKGWRAQELVEWVKSTGSEYVGVCLDMVNNVSLIEAPSTEMRVWVWLAFAGCGATGTGDSPGRGARAG